MALTNYDDAHAQLVSLGLIIDRTLDTGGRIQRWMVDGEDRERRGWSKLVEWTSPRGNTYIVGAFGVWHGNDDGKQKIELPKIDGTENGLSKEDLAAIKAKQALTNKQIEADRAAEAKQAARWAANVWEHCAPATEHEYLTRKQIKPNGARLMVDLDGMTHPGLDEANHYRLSMAKGSLVIPMHDHNAAVCGVQFIYPKDHPRRVKTGRDKEFWPSGMAMGGTFGLIGHIKRNGILLLCEGFATGASLADATGQTVAYAFSANNLIFAAKALRKAYTALRILICADDDYLTEGNPGCAAAAAASSAIDHCAWNKPNFLADDGTDPRNGNKLTDYNDLAVMTGLTLTLANQINARLDDLKWNERALVVAGDSPKWEGNKRKRAQSVMLMDEAIQRFIPIDDGTGKTVFDTQTNKLALKDAMIAVLPAGVRWDDIKRDPLWVQRGAYYLDQVGFDPTEKDKDCLLNTWQGWPMEPKQGHCYTLIEMIEYLCSDEDNSKEVFAWLMRWMAYPLQHPGAKLSSAVIMHGPQGTGKSTVFQTLAKIYGDYSTVLNQRGLEDKFNSDWSDSKLFILAEEVVTRAEMWHIKNELKELVSGEWIRINPKNIAAYRQRNQLNIVYLSNDDQPLPIENDDRRHLVVWTPPQVSEEFYDALYLELENGGVQAFYHYLLNLDMGDFHPKKRPPMTDAKRKLITLSNSGEREFVGQYLTGETGYPVCPSEVKDFFKGYMQWVRETNERNPRSLRQFGGMMTRMPKWVRKRVQIFTPGGKRSPAWVYIPPPEALAEHGNSQKESDTETKWVSESVQFFRDALRNGDER
jgi:putative DNA primase/helicase